MKILMINVVCGISSTGRICTDLAEQLEQRGHQVKIAYGRGNVPEKFQKYAVKIGTDLDIKLHGIKARLFDGAGFGSKAATEKFIKWVKEYDPDIIHLHNIHGYYINVEVLFNYLKTCNKKVIWTLHDCWAFTGHTAYCDAENCRKWETGCYKCPLLSAYPTSFVDKSKSNWGKKKKIFTNVPNMTIITPSEWLADWVKHSFMKKYPVYVINNGISTNCFYHRKSDFREKHGLTDKFVILGVATDWDKMKGYDDFIDLSRLLSDEFRIVLVGLTKKQLNELSAPILGIERTGSVNELAEIYSAADLFVNLTYCDNYPTVNIEAMACGTPVLTYRTGGSTEIVEKYGGIIVNDKNVKAVYQGILEAKRNKPEIKFIPTDNDNSMALKRYLQFYS